MTDDRKRRTPPYGGPILSDDARDRLVRKHRTPELGIPAEVHDETTGMHRRRTLESIQAHVAKLDDKVERLDEKVDQVTVNQAQSDGKLEVLLAETSKQTDVLAEIARTRVTVDAHREVSDIHVRQIRATTEIEDEADKKRKRRSLALKIVSAGAGAMASGGVLALLVQKACG